jgi:hypothetical protein
MSRYDPETIRVVLRIRKLIKQYGTSKIAEMVGRTASSVSQIKHGTRHKHTGALTINNLELQKVLNKLCRRCGESMQLVCRTGLCVECELLELHKQGLILIGGVAK